MLKLLVDVHGNSIAVAKLVEGRKVEEVCNILHDIKCGNKLTSCAAELAKALKQAYDKEQSK